jgi:hypothetical protein
MAPNQIKKNTVQKIAFGVSPIWISGKRSNTTVLVFRVFLNSCPRTLKSFFELGHDGSDS